MNKIMTLFRFIFSIIFIPIEWITNLLFQHKDNVLEWHLDYGREAIKVKTIHKEKVLTDELLIASYILFLARYFYICDERQVDVVRNFLSKQIEKSQENNKIALKLYDEVSKTLNQTEKKALVGLFKVLPIPNLIFSEDEEPIYVFTKYKFLVYRRKDGNGLANIFNMSTGADIIFLPLTVGILYEYVVNKLQDKNKNEKLDKSIADLLKKHSVVDCRSKVGLNELPNEVINNNNLDKTIWQQEQKSKETMVNLLNQGNYESAIKHGENFIKEFPEQVFFYIGISLAHSESGDTDTGISFLKEAEKIFPYSFELLFQLGKMYKNNFEFDNAISYLYKSFEATPTDRRKLRADCYNDIGAILSELGKEEEAVKLWEKALEIDPAHTLAKQNLKNNDSNGSQIDTTEFINNEKSKFSFYQMHKYFDDREKTKFSSKGEEKNFIDHIEDAFLKQIIPQLPEIEKMTEDEKIEFYEDREVNFDEPVQDFELPQFGIEVTGHLQNVFPYLPNDGILMIMVVLPALEYSGISEEKLNNFVSQTETPDGREIHILKWAYEVGRKVQEFTKITNSKKKETLFDEIIKLLNKELDENDSLIVMDSIMNRLYNDDDII